MNANLIFKWLRLSREGWLYLRRASAKQTMVAQIFVRVEVQPSVLSPGLALTSLPAEKMTAMPRRGARKSARRSVMVVSLPNGARLSLDADIYAQALRNDPFSGAAFVFRSKRDDYVKILTWDGSGLCLFAKLLEKGKCLNWASPDLCGGRSAMRVPTAIDGRLRQKRQRVRPSFRNHAVSSCVNTCFVLPVLNHAMMLSFNAPSTIDRQTHRQPPSGSVWMRAMARPLAGSMRLQSSGSGTSRPLRSTAVRRQMRPGVMGVRAPCGSRVVVVAVPMAVASPEYGAACLIKSSIICFDMYS